MTFRLRHATEVQETLKSWTNKQDVFYTLLGLNSRGVLVVVRKEVVEFKSWIRTSTIRRSVSSERSSSNRFFSASVIGIRLPASAASYTQKIIVRSCIYNSTWAQWISVNFIKEECRKTRIISALNALFNLFRSKTLTGVPLDCICTKTTKEPGHLRSVQDCV